MGLDDLMDDVDKYPIGSVNSRKDAKSMEFREREWKTVIGNMPEVVYMLSVRADKSDRKKLISMADDILQNGLDGHVLSDDQLELLEEMRNEAADLLD